MEIKFNHVVPAFLAGTTHFSSQVWGANLSLSSAQKVLVRAQSGKGKTTFLSYLFGSRKGYSGTITFDGTDIAGYNLDTWSNLRNNTISMVFQDLRLFDNLTVRENLELKLKLCPGTKIDESLTNLETLGMVTFIDRPCGQLSMGQQQRIAIVRSLAQPFKWLLMDEPFSHLDEENVAMAMELITAYCHKNKAGFLLSSLGSSHATLFDRTLEL